MTVAAGHATIAGSVATTVAIPTAAWSVAWKIAAAGNHISIRLEQWVLPNENEGVV